MFGILKKSLNDLFGKKVKFKDWQVLLFYSSFVLLALIVFVLT